MALNAMAAAVATMWAGVSLAQTNVNLGAGGTISTTGASDTLVLNATGGTRVTGPLTIGSAASAPVVTTNMGTGASGVPPVLVNNRNPDGTLTGTSTVFTVTRIGLSQATVTDTTAPGAITAGPNGTLSLTGGQATRTTILETYDLATSFDVDNATGLRIPNSERVGVEGIYNPSASDPNQQFQPGRSSMSTTVPIAGTPGGSMSLTGDSTVGGNSTVTGNSSVGGNLAVTGSTSTNGLSNTGTLSSSALSSTGNTSVGGNLAVTGSSTTNGVTNTGNIATSTLGTTGNASVGGALAVTGGSTTNGITNTGNIATSTLGTTGNASVGGALAVTGASTTNGLTNTGNIATSTLGTTGNASVGGALAVTGASTTNGLTNTGNIATSTLSTTGNASVGGALAVTGASTTNGITNTGNVATSTLSTTGNASVGGALAVTGGSTTNGIANTGNITNTGNVATSTLSTTGNATVGGALAVTGASTTNGITNTGNVATSTLSTTGAATFNGVTTVNNELRVQASGSGRTSQVTVTPDQIALTSNGAGLSLNGAQASLTNNTGHGLRVNGTSTVLSGGTNSTNLTLTDTAATFDTDGGPARVTGIANGRSQFDAVNYGQYRDLREELSQGIAAVTAMTNIPGVDPGKTFSFGVGVGGYDGEGGFAAGMSLRATETTVIKATVGGGLNGGEAAYGVGLSTSW